MILKPLKLRKYSHMKDNVVVWLEYVDIEFLNYIIKVEKYILDKKLYIIPDVYTPYVKYSLENWFIIENNGIYLYIINDKDITYTLPILINKGEVKVLEQIIKYLEQEYLRYISVN